MSSPIDLESRTVTHAGLLAEDYRGVALEPLREVGDRVLAGDVLLRDRRRAEIGLAAPVGGRVARIERGPRRRLRSVEIEIDDAAGSAEYRPPVDRGGAGLRALMLESGAWCNLRTRPFGNVPRPDSKPAAVFVAALDSEPPAPDPRPIIDACRDAFEAGILALAEVGAAPVYVCHAPDHSLGLGEDERIRCVAFGGGWEAGRPGVHIHALCPIGFAGGELWQIGYQEVISLGWLMLEGRHWSERVIAIGGDAVVHPRSLRTVPGASVSELLAGELHAGPVRVLSGSTLGGREIAADDAFVGVGQRQFTVLRGESGTPAAVSQAGDGPLIPSDVLEELAPPGIYPVPLLRALQIGDVERARELGALELLEEDLAPLSRACLSRCDYGALLRRVLNQLEESFR